VLYDKPISASGTRSLRSRPVAAGGWLQLPAAERIRRGNPARTLGFFPGSLGNRWLGSLEGCRSFCSNWQNRARAWAARACCSRQLRTSTSSTRTTRTRASVPWLRVVSRIVERFASEDRLRLSTRHPPGLARSITTGKVHRARTIFGWCVPAVRGCAYVVF